MRMCIPLRRKRRVPTLREETQEFMQSTQHKGCILNAGKCEEDNVEKRRKANRKKERRGERKERKGRGRKQIGRKRGEQGGEERD